MSFWGPKVFDSDGAADIRDAYRGMLLDKVPDDEAASRILDDFAEELADPGDGGSFAIALAVTMHKVGRLPEHIRTLALEAIDAGPEDWWTGPKGRNARLRVLEATRELLLSEQPAPKRLSRPWEENTSLTPGDVLALETDKGYGLLRVARLEKTRFGASPVIVTLDYRGTTVPSANALEAIPDLPRRAVWGSSRAPVVIESVGENLSRHLKRDHDFADVGFTLIGNVAQRPGDEDIVIQRGCGWDSAAARVASGSWFENIAEANRFAESALEALRQ